MENTRIGDERKSGHGHVASPLFTKLPAELRLKIYREAFTGAQAEAIPSQSPCPSDVEASSDAEYEYYEDDSLFYTCRQVYEETRPVYWSTVAVGVGYALKRHGGKLEEVLKDIPSYARPLIRELHFHHWYRRFEMSEFHGFLRQFKRLETVRVRTHGNYPPSYDEHTVCDCDEEDKVCECDFEPQWHEYLMGEALEAIGLSSRYVAMSLKPLNITVLQLAIYFITHSPNAYFVFINHTNGKTYEEATNYDYAFEFEEGFADSCFQEVL